MATRAVAPLAFVLLPLVLVLALPPQPLDGAVAHAGNTYLYLGPLVCSDASCPAPGPAGTTGGRAVNNSNFHLRDVAITAGPGGEFFLTGTSNSAGDGFWSDVYGVVRVWRSKTPLVPGSFVGGAVVFNLTYCWLSFTFAAAGVAPALGRRWPAGHASAMMPLP